MEEKKYNPFGSSINKVGRGSSTERDRAERETPIKRPSSSTRATQRTGRKGRGR